MRVWSTSSRVNSSQTTFLLARSLQACRAAGDLQTGVFGAGRATWGAFLCQAKWGRSLIDTLLGVDDTRHSPRVCKISSNLGIGMTDSARFWKIALQGAGAGAERHTALSTNQLVGSRPPDWPGSQRPLELSRASQQLQST
ncbi:hypothetical protein Micbo1qcDRAFT_160880 [Microdochium bolleyi]|uniref:Uncharacterized protein n=1 Tax=Microdochium bolleyi TaxID=196109 RepID=A0A136J757_9PEZI|nr:hypothetical protein Micbo1qcDRAFT_160880 [Microdochium bolleyi]